VCSSADCICGACYDFTCVTEQPETVMCLLRLTNHASTSVRAPGTRTGYAHRVRAPGTRTAAPNFNNCRTVETMHAQRMRHRQSKLQRYSHNTVSEYQSLQSFQRKQPEWSTPSVTMQGNKPFLKTLDACTHVTAISAAQELHR